MTHQENWQIETLRSSLDSAKETFKACLLINSGAAVALLAFMGHLITEKRIDLIRELAPCFKWYIAGLSTAIIGHGLSYFTNLYLSWDPEHRSATKLRFVAIALAILSLGSFGYGCWIAYRTFTGIAADATKTPAKIQELK